MGAWSLTVIGAILLFMIAGPLLIILNREIMLVYGFPFPILLSSMGVGASYVATYPSEMMKITHCHPS
jgi:hypothetical protein